MQISVQYFCSHLLGPPSLFLLVLISLIVMMLADKGLNYQLSLENTHFYGDCQGLIILKKNPPKYSTSNARILGIDTREKILFEVQVFIL